MQKRMKLLALILGCSLLGSACTNTMNSGPDSSNTPTINNSTDKTQSKLDAVRPDAYGSVMDLNLEPGSYISIIGRYDDNSYWEEVEAGAKRAVSDINQMLGYEGDDKIKLSFCSPDVADDVNEQISILDEELARYPIAIGISSIDASACMVQFDLATENSIPIVTFDSGSNYANIAAHISTDNVEAAQTAATKLAELMDNTGEILIITQDSHSTTAKQRTEAFTEQLSSIEDITIIDTYALDQKSSIVKEVVLSEYKTTDNADVDTNTNTDTEANIDTEANTDEVESDTTSATLPSDAELASKIDSVTQKDVIKYFITKNPNLKAIYATNLDTTLLVGEVVKNLEKNKAIDKDLLIVGFDGGDQTIKLLENGTIDGLIIQNPYGMGYATVVASARKVLELPNEAFVDSGYIWTTKELLSTPEVQKMLY